MDPHTQFCPNSACPASGQVGQGNIIIHSQREQRYRCTVCRKTFSARRGTPFYRQQHPVALITLVVTLVAHGCPLPAIVIAFGLNWRTVRRWVTAAGTHAQAVQEHLVEQPQDLGQVQADELRIKTQGGVLWVAMALQVGTRLWLGGEVSPHRDKALIRGLADRIARCAQAGRPLLLVADGLQTYVGAFLRACRSRVPGAKGRPRLVVWPGVIVGQVIKQYGPRRGRRGYGAVIGVVRRVAHGAAATVEQLLVTTQGGGVLNTAYIERLNATFRQRLASLGRRSRHLARQAGTLRAGMFLIGAIYNFCTCHESLILQERRRTPAMAAGITDHCWTIAELLQYKVPVPRWQPPKQRGRPSKRMRDLIARWAT